MRIGLLGRFNDHAVILTGPIEKQIEQHGTEGGQQNTGVNQRMQTMGHPLLEVGSDQGNHAHAD